MLTETHSKIAVIDVINFLEIFQFLLKLTCFKRPNAALLRAQRRPSTCILVTWHFYAFPLNYVRSQLQSVSDTQIDDVWRDRALHSPVPTSVPQAPSK